jgi:hypothetical protein
MTFSLKQWGQLLAHFAVGFITGYLLMTVFLWIVVRIGHALLWIFLLGPVLLGLFIGFGRLRRGARVGA